MNIFNKAFQKCIVGSYGFSVIKLGKKKLISFGVKS